MLAHRKVLSLVPLLTLAAGLSVHAADDAPLARTSTDPNLKWGACPDFMPRGCQIAVLHGDPSKDNADVFFKVPANAEIPRHWHTSAERMVLVEGNLYVTYDGHDPVTLKPGTYAYGPAKLPHKASCGPVAACVLFIAFESPVDAFAGAPGDK
jgi:quercetin dioxygenase-like cupin family protein